MKPPNHGLLHLVTIDEEDVGGTFEGFLILAHPSAFTGLALASPDLHPPLHIAHTDRIEVLP